MSGPATASVHLMVQDPSYGATADTLDVVKLTLRDSSVDRFFDGPATRRVAVVDFDPETRLPLPAPVVFEPGVASSIVGTYRTADLAPDTPAFLAVNVFGTVLETIELFESVAGLGRQVVWAFPGEQLLVVPRAGKRANAFYDRASRSLQFFWFEGTKGTVYTALSRDIIAHECGHALIDAVVPSLHDAVTPESIAIHEALADLIAVLMALNCPKLRIAALAAHGFSIDDAGVFGWIAEEFGTARGEGDAPTHALRDLRNRTTMSDVRTKSAHVKSTVLSGLLYDSLLEIFTATKKKRLDATAPDPTGSEEAAANFALGSSLTIFKRLLLRGIDYLPPGELTFADVVRATLAADRAGDVQARGEAGRLRFAERAVERQIAAHVDDVLPVEPSGIDLDDIRLEDLRDSDWVAYQFVERHRAALGVRADVPFIVLPRVDATKEIGFKTQGAKRYDLQRELILKVTWDEDEDNGVDRLARAKKRRLRTGVTLAIRWVDKHPLALVRSDVDHDEHRRARDEIIAALAANGELTPAPGDGAVVDGDAAAQYRIADGKLEIVGTHRLLHLGGDR